jgi:enamine deaminase RidA (YjgF/YER057c/UK114 family)
VTVARWTPEGVTAPIGAYSHLAAARGEVVHFSGQVGTGRDGALAGDTLEAQTRQVFANVADLLEAAGARTDQLVKLLTFVVGPTDLSSFRAARDEVYAEWFPSGDWPAHSLAFVAGLARQDLLIEMEGVFVREPSANEPSGIGFGSNGPGRSDPHSREPRT